MPSCSKQPVASPSLVSCEQQSLPLHPCASLILWPTHLSINDIAIDNCQPPDLVCNCAHIKQSKQTPFVKGSLSSYIHVGCSSANICPVHTITQYLAARGAQQDPLFLLANGPPLSRAGLVQKMRQALVSSGLDPKTYNGHSFRIGAATTAASKGIEDALIQMLGRW